MSHAIDSKEVSSLFYSVLILFWLVEFTYYGLTYVIQSCTEEVIFHFFGSYNWRWSIFRQKIAYQRQLESKESKYLP